MSKHITRRALPPTIEKSPALAYFPPPEDGLIPFSAAKIAWNLKWLEPGGAYRVQNVTIFWHPISRLFNPEHPVVKAADALDDEADCVVNGWEGSQYNARNLPLLWQEWVEDGFATDEAARRAAREFAYIRECPWARKPNFHIPKCRPWTIDELLASEAAYSAKRGPGRQKLCGELTIITPAAWVGKTPPPRKILDGARV